MDLLPILTDNGEYPEMEIGLLQTGSSNNYATEGVIRDIPTLKPTFSGSPITMVVSLIPFDTDN